MAKRLIELIEQAGDLALSKHIPLTSEIIASHLIRCGMKIPVCCKDSVIFHTALSAAQTVTSLPATNPCHIPRMLPEKLCRTL